MESRLHCLAIFTLSLALAGCTSSESSQSGSVATTQVVFNPSGAPTVEFSVPDMMCEASCAAKVREILSEQAGVKDVKVDFPNKVAFVAVDEGLFDEKNAIAQLVDHQFTNSTVVEMPAAEAPQVQ
jgi:copper chaperone CopZ